MRMMRYCAWWLCFIMTSCMLFPPPQSPVTSDQSNTLVQPTTVPTNINAFRLTSPDIDASGVLPRAYTCDGESSTLPLAWSNAPAGTVSYAVVMHHIPGPGDVHWYWVLYNIPADVTALAANSTGVGTLGTNSVNDRNEYAPPCSKGPGPKTYTYTVYALSAMPQLPSSGVDRATFLAAADAITLASATLDVVYSRP